MPPAPKASFEPSRLVVNVGILVGGAIGIFLSLSQNLDGVNAFLLTGFCSLLAVALFSYTEVFIIRPRNKK